MSETIKVLLDTDIGTDIDDAVALAYLLSQKRCELLGITTCTGEADKRAEMASAICRHVGRGDIPIHAGVKKALLIDMPQKIAHQAPALRDWDRQRDFPDGTAVDFLRRTIRANPGQVTLLTIGPLTNVAVLFALDPEIPSLLGQLVLMCGRFFESMGGEWNAYNDPHATAIVYGNGCQSRPPRHITYGLDVTTKCQMPAEEVRRRFSAKVMQPVLDFAEIWFKERPAITFHDPLAAACIFEPDICQYRTGRVIVPTAEPTAGWTIFQGNPEGPHQAACKVDAERFFKHYFDVVK